MQTVRRGRVAVYYKSNVLYIPSPGIYLDIVGDIRSMMTMSPSQTNGIDEKYVICAVDISNAGTIMNGCHLTLLVKKIMVHVH